MNTITQLLTCPAVERLGWALIHFVWEGAILALLLAAALSIMKHRSASSRYLLAYRTLLVMMLCLVLNMMWFCKPSPGVDPVMLSRAAGSELLPPAAPGPTWSGAPVDQAVARTQDVHSHAADRASTAAPTAAIPWRHRLNAAVDGCLPWAVLCWISGVTVLSLRLTIAWTMVQRIRRRCIEPVAEHWQASTQRIARRLAISRPVHIVQSALAQVPSVIGWIKPVILLPASVLTQMSPEQIEAVIAHELAHIRRFDYLANLVQSVIETLLFYHPGVWWVSRRIRVEREHCCDDIAVAVCGNQVTYARALSSMESLRGAPGLVAAATGGSLVHRIRRILGVQATGSNQFARYAAGLLVTSTVVAFLVVVQVTARTAQAKPADAPTSQPTAITPVSPGVLVEKTAAKDAARTDRWRHFARIVVNEKGTITFEGKLTDWKNIIPTGLMGMGGFGGGMMGGMGGGMGGMSSGDDENTPQVWPTGPNNGEPGPSPNRFTVVELAKASQDVPESIIEQAMPRASRFVKKYGYEYLSLTGVAPFGSKGSPSQYLKPLTQRGRWRHFARLVVNPSRPWLSVDLPPGCEPDPTQGWIGQARCLPDRQWTVLELTVAPNTLTPEQYEQARREIEEQAKSLGMEGVSDLKVRPWTEEPSPSQFVPDEKQPGEWMSYPLLVVGKDAMTFEGEPIGWSQIEAKLSSLPDRQHTCLCVALASESLMPQHQDILTRLDPIDARSAIRHRSFVGVHPLGTKGGPPIFTPTSPTRPASSEPSQLGTGGPPGAAQPGLPADAGGPGATTQHGQRSVQELETKLRQAMLDLGAIQVQAKTGSDRETRYAAQQAEKNAKAAVDEIIGEFELEVEAATITLDGAMEQVALSKQRYQAGLTDGREFRSASTAGKLAEIALKRWAKALERARKTAGQASSSQTASPETEVPPSAQPK